MVKFTFVFLGLALFASAQSTAFPVIISEIMADPHPGVLLPDAEYIELLNRSNEPVNLNGWQLYFGTKERTLSAAVLGPGEYLIICESGKEGLFLTQGKTMALPDMPAIVNTGQTLILKSATGKTMHAVSFTDRWYHSSFKAEGGWSLEIIDPDNPCGRSDNWSESMDYHGGTPGHENSVSACNPDQESPFLLRATMISDSMVKLYFNEYMDSASLSDPLCYSVNKGILHPKAAVPVGPEFRSLVLDYSRRFEASEIYTVTVLNTLKDCVGNNLHNRAGVDFSVPLSCDSFDVVINEIMVDPDSGMSEYIELYNRSGHVLDLSECSLALADPFTAKISKIISLNENPFLLFPDHYAVVTRNIMGLPVICTEKYPSNLVEQTDLFTLPNITGVILVLNGQFKTIDELHYTRSMHHEILTGTSGVSLERVHADGSTNDPMNWHSASATEGYATPGYRNSQSIDDYPACDDLVLQPEVFSPDNDGIDDIATIRLTFSDPGYLANIVIFDTEGRKIKTLASNTLLGTTAELTWDGTTYDHSPAGVGIYLVYAEFFNRHGQIKRYKKVIALAR